MTQSVALSSPSTAVLASHGPINEMIHILYYEVVWQHSELNRTGKGISTVGKWATVL